MWQSSAKERKFHHFVKWMLNWDIFECKKLFIFKWRALRFKQRLIRKYGNKLSYIKII